MKKLYALFFCSILMIAVATAAVIEMPVAPAIAHMGLPVIGGNVPAPAGGVLLGNDTIESANSVYMANDNAYFYQDAFTQSPIGQQATTSGSATKAKIYIERGGTATLYVAVCDTDGDILATGSTAITSADDDTWVEITLSSSVTITNGNYYGLCIGREAASGTYELVGGDRIGTSVGASTASYDWESPGTITDDGAVVSGPLSAYLY